MTPSTPKIQVTFGQADIIAAAQQARFSPEYNFVTGRGQKGFQIVQTIEEDQAREAIIAYAKPLIAPVYNYLTVVFGRNDKEVVAIVTAEVVTEVGSTNADRDEASTAAEVAKAVNNTAVTSRVADEPEDDTKVPPAGSIFEAALASDEAEPEAKGIFGELVKPSNAATTDA